MPHITPAEVAVVAAAFVLFYFVPALVGWRDASRRRKLFRQRAAAGTGDLVHQGTGVLAGAAPREPDAAAPATETELPAKLDSGEDVIGAAPMGEVALAAEEPVTAQSAETLQASAADVPGAPAEPSVAPAALELQPLATPARHRFRLQDLHRTQLSDWPPAVIRHDAERNRVWQEAARVAEEYRAMIDDATILSPYPARATCLGGGEVDGPIVRLRYLLFPSVWPVSENQAVAEAVFEVDRTHAGIRGWVDALRASELSEDNRREIHQSGGEV